MDKPIGREVIRQTIALVFSVISVVVTVYAVRYLTNPDSAREFKMRSALKGKRYAQRQADRWQAGADWFATKYNEEKA